MKLYRMGVVATGVMASYSSNDEPTKRHDWIEATRHLHDVPHGKDSQDWCGSKAAAQPLSSHDVSSLALFSGTHLIRIRLMRHVGPV